MILRVGVFLDAPCVPSWIQRVLFELAQEQDVELALVAFVSGPAPPRPRGPGALLLRLYERLDRALFRERLDHARILDAGPLLEGTPQLQVRAVGGPAGAVLEEAGLKQIQALDLDVLVHLGTTPLDGGVRQAARLGFWTLSHQALEREATPFCFWEMYRADPVVETALLDARSEPPRTLYRSRAAVRGTSLYRNHNPSYWKSSEFVMRGLRALLRGAAADARGAAADAPGGAPGLLTVLRFGFRLASRWARTRWLWRRFHWQWFVAVRPVAGPLDDAAPADPAPLPVPPGRFHADPFLLEVDGRHHLFFEDADFASEKGVIRWLELGADGSPGASCVVLERDYHLSYPFVFRWQGEVWMIPETSANRTIELYRATAFPERWELEKVLFSDVLAVDTTLCETAGRFWLFTAMSVAGGSVNDELFLFHADSPLGSWLPHPLNPIVSDVRRARPAGPLFRHAGALIRPGQDCATPYLVQESYGAAIWLNRVDVLDERDYRETPLRRIGPGWYPGNLATHTICQAGGLEARDGRRLVRRR